MKTNLKQEQLFKKILHAIKVHQGAMFRFFESTTEFLINFFINSNLVDFHCTCIFFCLVLLTRHSRTHRLVEDKLAKYLP